MKVRKRHASLFPDLAFDESAERCCGDDPTKDYRCVLGTPSLTYQAGSPPDPNVAVTDQCIESRLVCDGDPDGVDHCANGADESACLAISATEVSHPIILIVDLLIFYGTFAF